MREIKFRAWDKQKGELYEVKALGWYIDGFACNDSCSLQNEDSDERNFRSNYLANDHRDFVLMQFTGLKDKNGTEIYEGDILKGEAYENDTFKVVWAGNHYGVGFACFSGHAMVDMEDDWSDLEVIGNIHQNPELLK